MDGKLILVIEDDAFVRRTIEAVFERAGATVIGASNGAEGLRKFFNRRPDLVTLDIMMPDMDGWETCRQIRQLDDTPIIMLTSIDDEEAEVRALEMGAVDFVTKPYSARVLLARARAALRRSATEPDQPQRDEYHDDHLSIDLNGRRLAVDGRHVALTKTEFDLLAYLVRNKGMVLSFGQILEAVWGVGYESNTDYVHVYISRLRRKIERDARQPTYLITVHGQGYLFET
jgi:DNA-binding response OmpR family regulator